MFSSWRGIIGVVHPTLRPGSNEELIRMLPKASAFSQLHVNIKRGTRMNSRRSRSPMRRNSNC